jgi:hypothetical protein
MLARRAPSVRRDIPAGHGGRRRRNRANGRKEGLPPAILEAEMDAILTFGPPSSILPRASLCVHGRPASLSRLRPRLVPVLSPCAHPPRPRLCPPMGPAHAPPMPRPCPAHAMSRRRRSATLAPLSTALGTGCPWETQNARKTRPDAARRDAGKCAHRGAVLASALRPARCRIAALYPAAFVWTQALAHCLPCAL